VGSIVELVAARKPRAMFGNDLSDRLLYVAWKSVAERKNGQE
jgi:hypothetical protein